MQVLNRQLNENPGLYKKMYDVEYAYKKVYRLLKETSKGMVVATWWRKWW